MYSVLFMGTPEEAVPSLRALAQREAFCVTDVYTQPDRLGGRGHSTLISPPVKKVAQELGIPVHQPEHLPPPAGEKPDFLVVVAYGKLLSDAWLAFPRFAAVNLHFSLLPRYRGAAPVEPALLSGDADAGYCYAHMVQELDAGPLYASVARPLTGVETARELYAHCAEEGGRGFPDVLLRIANGEPPVPQQGEVSFAPKLRKEQGALLAQQGAVMIDRAFRALSGRVRLYLTSETGERLLVTALSVTHRPSPHAAGTLFVEEGALCLAVRDGVVLLHEVQEEGKKPIAGMVYAATRPLLLAVKYL